MTRAFNKATWIWLDTECDPTIVTDSNWIIDPIFDNEAWANQIGPIYWSFPGGNSITTPTVDSYNASQLIIQQNSSWRLIQAERDRRKGTGGYKVGNYWFHSDDTSRIQQIALVMMGAGMPSGIMWKTMTGEFVLMTPTLAGQIFQAAASSDIVIFSVAESKKVAMMSSTTPNTYDYLSGWPLMFGE